MTDSKHTPWEGISEGLNAATDNLGAWTDKDMRFQLQALRVKADRACNSHEALVAKLASLIKAVSDTSMLPEKERWFEPELEEAKSALAAAEAEGR